METKICRGCGELKCLFEFNRDKRAGGLRSARGGLGVAASCKACLSESRKPGIILDRSKKAELRSGQRKACTVCKTVKPFEEFSKRKASEDGLAFKCRDCYLAYAKQWRLDNPGAFREWATPRISALRERSKQWRSANKEQRAIYMSQWSKDNAALVNAKCAKRNAAKLRATPAWACDDSISLIYARAAELTISTGVRHEVDHFYPLQGKMVCGLHCTENLQVLTKAANISKLNRMPEEWSGAAA